MIDGTPKLASYVPRRRYIDAFILFFAFLAAALVALEFDLFLNADHRSERELRIEISEALLLGTVLAISLLVFSFRRLQDQKREIALRLGAETRARQALELALLDPLTGLANRRHFDDIFGAAASRGQHASRHALFLFDLNDFKGINDTYGHPAGDRILQVVSERLGAALKTGDLASRLGGDEFAVIAFDIGEEKQAEALAARLRAVVAEPVILDGLELRPSASVGYALFPSGGMNASDIFAKADAALYVAKAQKPKRLTTKTETHPDP